MSEGWAMKQWSEVLEIRSGRNQKEVLNPNGKYPILGSAGKVMGYADDYICEEGTTIIGRKGTINSPLFITKKFWNVDTAFGLHAKEGLDKNYLHYFCLSFDFTEMDRGSGRPSLVKSDLLKIPIPIPPLPEQKQIVAILDKAFAAIDQARANIEKNIENAKELFQSKLNEIFSQLALSGVEGKGDGWEEKTLGEVCEIIMGQSPKGTSYNSEGIGTPLINGPVEFGAEPFSKTVMSKWTTQPTKLCEEGDLILCVRGSTTGRINIAGFQACIGRGVAAIRNVKSQKWINFFIRCNQQTIYDLGTGSTFPNVSSKILANLKIIQPKSITTQNEFVDLMEELDANQSKMKSHYQQKLTNLEDLKKSILQKAFSGALTKEATVSKYATVQ
ncbi:restriction endonuclease subunit S [Cytophaga sp. FL35]|uniref:restriction endonuclease subunit S n=1 Tax=Cytophaga sp. FL35 TaxID=1904456 RepID=UPI001653C054|nr:restriction endonuclease subunit S [Cytophaga sp. FL35]MBC7000339.1 restriction endonuclease subunit S [Cytophaga sp. FL35]